MLNPRHVNLKHIGSSSNKSNTCVLMKCSKGPTHTVLKSECTQTKGRTRSNQAIVFTSNVPRGSRTCGGRGTEWYADKGVNSVSKLSMVQKIERALFRQNSLTFLKEYYPRAVAFCPNDPLHLLDEDDERRTYFQVIDRNEDV